MAMIRINETKELKELCGKIAAGEVPAVMLVGPPGQGKTQTLTAAIGKRPHLPLRGRVSALSLYQNLYHHRDHLVLLDDTAEMLKDRQVQELLRDLCETTVPSLISWHTQSSILSEAKIPSSFLTESPLCVIANEIGSDGIWTALTSRCLVVEIEFTWQELIKEVRRTTWFGDEEILGYADKNARCVADLRFLKMAEEMKRLRLGDWRQQFGGPAQPFGPAVDREKIVALIESEPGVGLYDLHRRLGMKIRSNVLRKTLGEMVGEGVVRHRKQKTKGRPTTKYWLNGSGRPRSTLPELCPRNDGVWLRLLAALRRLMFSLRSRPTEHATGRPRSRPRR